MAHYSGPVIDAHHHLWRAPPGNHAQAHPWLKDKPALTRDFTAADFAADFAGIDIVATVWIEALARDPEAELARAEAERRASEGRIATGLVAHAPLDAPDIGARLDRLMQCSPALRGVRDIVSSGAGRSSPARRADLLALPGFHAGLGALEDRGLSLDLMLRPHQMLQAVKLLERRPGLSVAIEHAGDPWDQTAAGLSEWAQGLRALSEHPATILKVSALQCHDPGWTMDSLHRLVTPMTEIFGPKRMAWGSDWPVHDSACPGPVAFAAMCKLTESWAAQARDSFFKGTAQRFYRIDLPSLHVDRAASGQD